MIGSVLKKKRFQDPGCEILNNDESTGTIIKKIMICKQKHIAY